MGKRKSSAKPPPKKSRPKLETMFACPFCNAEKSVHCEIDRETKVGQVKCNLCHAQYAVPINELSEPIDVYSEWIDACEEENKEGAVVQQEEQDERRAPPRREARQEEEDE